MSDDVKLARTAGLQLQRRASVSCSSRLKAPRTDRAVAHRPPSSSAFSDPHLAGK